MNKRTRVIAAVVMLIMGGAMLSFNFIGGGELEAAMIAETGVNWARIITWTGVGLIVVSSLMFISASAE